VTSLLKILGIIAGCSAALTAHANDETEPSKVVITAPRPPKEFNHLTESLTSGYNLYEFNANVDIGEPTRPSESNKEDPKDDTDKPQDCGGGGDAGSSAPLSGHPVVLSTGEKFETELDFGSPKLYGLSLGRTYRSNSARAGIFGKKWLSQYDFSRLTYSTCERDPDNPAVCVPSAAVVGLPAPRRFVWNATSTIAARSRA